MIIDFFISFIVTIIILNIISEMYNFIFPKHSHIYYLLKDRRAKIKHCPGCKICRYSFRGRRNIGEVHGITRKNSYNYW